MSEAQHTPGPWGYTKAAISGDRGIRAEGTGIFAEAFADIRRAGENNAAEAEANARLIAAAPELLAALKAVVAVADRDTDEFNTAREVIHRAEGGQ